MNEISGSQIRATFSLSKFGDNKVTSKDLQAKEDIFDKLNSARKEFKPVSFTDNCKVMLSLMYFFAVIFKIDLKRTHYK
jgi:hypothetical protein